MVSDTLERSGGSFLAHSSGLLCIILATLICAHFKILYQKNLVDDLPGHITSEFIVSRLREEEDFREEPIIVCKRGEKFGLERYPRLEVPRFFYIIIMLSSPEVAEKAVEFLNGRLLMDAEIIARRYHGQHDNEQMEISEL